MLDVKLDTKYKLTSDAMNYRLEQRSKTKNKEGEYTWSAIKFSNTITHLMESYKELLIRESDCTTIPEILELVKKIDENIDRVLKGL